MAAAVRRPARRGHSHARDAAAADLRRPGALPEIEEHLRWAASRCTPFDIHLRGTATLPAGVACGLRPAGAGIGGCERSSPRPLGPLARELRFPYHPHVTVAHDLPDAALDAAFTALATYEARFTVTGFSLYEHIGGVWRPRTAYDFPH